MVKLGAAIVSVKVAVDVSFPDVPVMVTVLLPGGTAPVAESVKTEFPVVGFGEKLAVTPLGSPDTARLIAPRKPYNCEIGIGLLTVVPWPKLRFPGLEIEKLGAWMAKGKVAVEL